MRKILGFWFKTYCFDPNCFDRTFAFFRLNSGDSKYVVHSLDDLAEDRIAIIKGRLTFQSNEEL